MERERENVYIYQSKVIGTWGFLQSLYFCECLQFSLIKVEMQKLIIKPVLVKNYKSISQFLALKTQESLREAAFLDSSEDTTPPTPPPQL